MSASHSFFDRFSTFLSEYIDDPGATRYLLAISGGIDSMVMLHLFNKVGLPFEVAHCNFNLRGEDSNEDEQFVKGACDKYNIRCTTQSFDTLSVSEARGISTQMAARELRYTWFEELLIKNKFDLLCTAHHKGDHAETVLFNLTKGTGIAGLHGIQPLKGQLLRPLMSFTREEIEAFARTEGIVWREDTSNASNKYSRNLIRNKVMPLLKQINPSVEQSIWNSSERILKVETWLSEQIEEWRRKVQRKDGEIVYISLKQLDRSQHRTLILTELIKPFGFSYAEIDQIIDPSQPRTGRQFKSREYELVYDREQLVITPLKQEGIKKLTIKGPGEHGFSDFRFKLDIVPRKDWELDRSREVLQVDVDKVLWPLTLRRWQQGDTIQPLGMRGRKKISDILIDEKIPLNLKSRQLVLKDERDIIWLVGMRMSESFKVEERSELVMNISTIEVPSNS